jgi:hypothetical protein
MFRILTRVVTIKVHNTLLFLTLYTDAVATIKAIERQVVRWIDYMC